MGEIKFKRAMYEVKEEGITKTVYLLDEKLKISGSGKVLWSISREKRNKKRAPMQVPPCCFILCVGWNGEGPYEIVGCYVKGWQDVCQPGCLDCC